MNTFPMFDRDVPRSERFAIVPYGRGTSHYAVYNVHMKGGRSGIALSMGLFASEAEARAWTKRQF